jgi:transposase
MLAEGMSVRDVAEEVGISKSAVQRLKNNPLSQVSRFAEAAPKESGTLAEINA